MKAPPAGVAPEPRLRRCRSRVGRLRVYAACGAKGAGEMGSTSITRGVGSSAIASHLAAASLPSAAFASLHLYHRSVITTSRRPPWRRMQLAT
eukprot:502721-Pleurochrysis_carterae.AAC.3